MVLTSYQKQRILFHRSKGLKPPTIARLLLEEENIRVSQISVYKFLRRYSETASIARKPRSGRPSTITQEIKQIVEAQMQEDDETSAVQLHALLKSKGINISRRTVLHCRLSLGWTFRGSAYCQMIRQANKEKRLEFAQTNREDDFENVVFTDESTIQLSSHRRFCCRKVNEPPKLKPR